MFKLIRLAWTLTTICVILAIVVGVSSLLSGRFTIPFIGESEQSARDIAQSAARSAADRLIDSLADTGEWVLDFAPKQRTPYVLLSGGAAAQIGGDRSQQNPYAGLVSDLIVSCDDRVSLDFWAPELRRWGAGPPLAEPGMPSETQITYRFGGGTSGSAKWLPSSDGRSAVASGEAGAEFVGTLAEASGGLRLTFETGSGGLHEIEFPPVDGFSEAYRHLEQCPG